MRLSESFISVQGEGHLSGKMMYFLRTQGCSIKMCPIRSVCDEPKALKNNGGTNYSVAGILELIHREIAHTRNRWVCLTGGEPTDQSDFSEVVAEIRSAGYLVHIQTSGVNRVDCQWDWLTVSPKLPAKELKQRYGNELKVVYTGQEDHVLNDYEIYFKAWNYYLQPLDKNGRKNTKATIKKLNEINSKDFPFPGGVEWELSLQTHKWIGVK